MFVVPIVEYHGTKVGKEGIVLLACYERLIAVNEKLTKEIKPLLELPYFKLKGADPFVHIVRYNIVFLNKRMCRFRL
jgi:hypothetical protein